MNSQAPNFYSDQLISAEIHMNELIRSVNDAYGSLKSPTTSTYGHQEYYYHDESAGEYIYSNTYIRHYAIDFYLGITIEMEPGAALPEPEDDLVVEVTSTAYVEGTRKLTPMGDTVVEGDYRHMVYNTSPHDIPVGEEYKVKIYSTTNISSNFRMYKPYEVSIYSPLTEIKDFLTGTPTIYDWEDLSDAAQELLDRKNLVNDGFLSTIWDNDIDTVQETVIYKNIHRNRYLFQNYQIKWPEREVRIDQDDYGSSYDVLCEVNGERIFHHGRYIVHGAGTDPIDIYDKMYAEVNDRISIHGKNGYITNIVTQSGYYEVYIDWDDSPPSIVNYMDGLTVRSPLEYSDTIMGRPTIESDDYRNFDNYHLLVDLTPFGFDLGETYSVKFTTDRETPAGIDGNKGELFLGFIGETVNIETGQPETGWKKMAEWSHLDTVPGTGDKAINNIVENIRFLQELNVIQQGCTRFRPNTDEHYDICFSHKYRWLAIQLQLDDEGELPEPTITYYSSGDWVTENLTYDEDVGNFEYVDLNEFTQLTVGSFYTLQNVSYAYEIDLASEL